MRWLGVEPTSCSPTPTAPVIDRSRALLAAAQRALPAERIRELHDRPVRRVHDLLERGRTEGVFRTDLLATTLLSAFTRVDENAREPT
jgi:TetR/AcrR family transcriptional regulator, mexCD-oprJ operon repressor